MKVGIITKNSAEAEKTAASVIKKLKSLSITPITSNLETENTDLIISVGGDGTFLQSAFVSGDRQIPILGINMGKVGYLTELENSEIDELSRISTGDFQIEERMMLDAEIIRDGVQISAFRALNDAAIKNGHVARMLDITLSCNGEKISEYRADGILASTPTGSTAYSLSAGGPVIDPVMSCLLIIAICPHSINSRPILFSDKSLLCAEVSNLTEKDAFLTIDGRESAELFENDKVLIKKSKIVTKVVRLKNVNFNETLNKKFGSVGSGK